MTSQRYTVDNWRWTARRKAELLDRVDKGEIGDAELAILGISRDEVAEWQKYHARGGVKALRATRLLTYRGT